ncbi:Ankyrin_repeat-containing protein [Hexamita inflata]|uniref:Ankyrin repeat-containing protein n=1 Tax=Hexamita inflata TaxID=28002 RepID=A0AA86NGS7_9EUKA|nr:Ankyrin repeat-containing protein [Hexamita inflata]CAI9927997.1 Ankyrin repeat-containing protein [Hexamita inflata]
MRNQKPLPEFWVPTSKPSPDIEPMLKAAVQAEFPPQTTELMMAAAYGDIFTCKKVFRDLLNMENAHGMTALMYACQGGRMEVTQMLIKYEDLRHKNKQGLTAVDLAFRARQAEMCLFLEDYCIKKGYDLRPQVRSDVKQQAAAVQKFKRDYDLDANRMFDYVEESRVKK